VHLNTDIHNYYEHLVTEHITVNKYDETYDKEFIDDVSCFALNLLPSRYIRHDVDMAFYLTSGDRHNMVKEVNIAMVESLEYLLKKAKINE